MPHQCAHWFAMTCRKKRRVSGCKDVPHCHCEERSDVAIRSPCGSTERKAVLWANSQFLCIRPSNSGLSGYPAGTRIATPVCALVRNDNRGAWVRIRPKYCQLVSFLCGENGLPHQCAHWFAMTCRRQRRGYGCKVVADNNMQKTGRCQRLQGRPPLSLRGAKRRGNP